MVRYIMILWDALVLPQGDDWMQMVSGVDDVLDCG